VPEGPAAVNARYYAARGAGVDDYWRLMAAPRRRRRVLLAALLARRPASVVDLGCGSGELLAEVAARLPDARLCGVDLPGVAGGPGLVGVRRLAADLGRPFDPPADLEPFDVAVASELLEHLERPAALLDNARRLVRPGGALLLSTQSGPVRATERVVGHVRHFAAGDVAALLAAAGWRPVRVWNEGFPFHDLSKWLANLRPEAALAGFGAGRYGVAQRCACALLRAAFRCNSRRRGAQLFAIAVRQDGGGAGR
jgi:SAM-dependent methyltransferase